MLIPRCGRWLRAWLAMALGGLLALGAWAQGGQAPTWLRHAEFQAPGQDGWQGVDLPHDWAAAGLATPGTGRYRLVFNLPALDGQPWALWARDLAPGRQVWLNGQLVHQQMQQPEHWRARRPGMALVELPPALLRAGSNELLLVQSFGTTGHLSDLGLGVLDTMQLYHRNQHLLWMQLPQGLNLAAAGLSLFMLAVWWQRRGETAIGSFGALWLLLSLRNTTYYVPAAPVGNFTSGLFYAVQVLSVPMVGLFAMALARRRPRWFVRTLWGLVLVLLPAGVAAAWTDQLLLLRRWTYPLLVALYLPSLWLMFGATRGVRARHLFPVAVGLALTIAAGAHDLLYALNHWRGAGHFLLPFAMPLTMGLFAWNLLRRLVHGLVRTERQKDALERRVAERTRDLQEANAAKGRFIAAASHDLRQPVVTLGLMASMLREQPAGPAAQRLVDKMHDAAMGLERLVHGLLDLSRLDAGAALRLQPVDLAALFAAVALQEGEAARAKGVQLRVRPGAPTVVSDAVLLEQVVRNLVSNAVRCTQRGGVLLAARRRRDGRVLLQVWDSGPGIAPEHQARIFEAFVRLDAAGTPGPSRGVGLGLAIAQRAANTLGAALALQSQAGCGSRFTLALPASANPPT